MTGISEDYSNEPISKYHLQYMSYSNSQSPDKYTYLSEGFKDITIDNDEFWYDRNGPEEKELIINKDLFNIMLPVLNKRIQERNAKN